MTGDLRLGFACLFGAYAIWGALPLYFRLMAHITPAELLAHRIVWSVPTGLLFIALARNWRQLAAVLTLRRLGYLSASAVLIGANWLIYLWAVSEERVRELLPNCVEVLITDANKLARCACDKVSRTVLFAK